MITTVVSFIIVLGIIVFVHEFGHFLAAKLSGVRVEVFSLGFPPKMLSRRIGETEYQIAWIPLGGYVKMTGMLDESFDRDFDPNDPRCFVAQPFHKRFFIISAGVAMNMLLGLSLYSGIYWAEGIPVNAKIDTTISEVASGSPAEQAGIRPGDRIIEAAGEPTPEWGDLVKVIHRYPGAPITVTWIHTDSSGHDTTISKQITPAVAPLLGFKRKSVGKLGVIAEVERRRIGPLTALVYGTDQVIGVLVTNVISLYWLLSGQAHIRELTGPVGIARESGRSARSGLASFVMFIAFISVSIGFLNILPIPMLDGGYLLFMCVEAVIRRPIPEKLKLNLIRIGLALLIALVLVVSYHDILRIFFKNE